LTKTPLILATRNPGKLRELQALLADLPVEVLPLPADAPEVAETADTFAGNAELKARAAQATGDRRQATVGAADTEGDSGEWLAPAANSVACRLSPVAWVIADDSGLEVDALGGAPGDCVAKLLAELQGVPDAARTARFRCAIALLASDGRLWIDEGVLEGRITHAPRGTNGFGYDPVFLLPERGLTTAELDPEEKNRISHRGQALAKAVERLRRFL
jgi:XTP/dITP diphosphohydrolase